MSTVKLDLGALIGAHAVTEQQGFDAYRAADDLILQGYRVCLDFTNIDTANASFFNALVGNLYHRYRARYSEVVETLGLEHDAQRKRDYDYAIQRLAAR